MAEQDNIRAPIVCEGLPSKLSEALASGSKTYYTGKPCKNGHLAPKFTRSRTCVECNTIKRIAYQRKNAEVIREKSREWAKNNKDKAAAKARRWRSSNPEASAKASTKYRLKNLEKFAHQERIRRARKRSAEGTHSIEDIQRIRTLQKDRCACCRVRLRGKGEVDHILALAKGGSNYPSNLQLLCKTCNTRKNARDSIEFMRDQGRLL